MGCLLRVLFNSTLKNYALVSKHIPILFNNYEPSKSLNLGLNNGLIISNIYKNIKNMLQRKLRIAYVSRVTCVTLI